MFRWALPLLSTASFSACGATPSTSADTRPAHVSAAPAAPTASASTRSDLPSWKISSLPSPESTLLFARGTGPEALILVPSDAGWTARAIDLRGPGMTVPTVVELPGLGSGPASLRAVASGFELVWAVEDGKKTHLYLARFSSTGSLARAPQKVATLSASLQAMDLAALGENQTLIAIETEGEGRALGYIVVQPTMVTPLTSMTSIERAPISWVVASSSAKSGAGPHSAWMAVASTDSKSGDSLARIALHTIQSSGSARSFVLTKAPTALPDVDLAVSEDNAVAAWTDAGGSDSHVVVATVNASHGVTHQARALAPSEGDQALLGFATPNNTASPLILWENPSHENEVRFVKMGWLTAVGTLEGPRGEVIMNGTNIPDVTVTDGGLGLVTLATTGQPATGAQSEASQVWPIGALADRDFKTAWAGPIVSSSLFPEESGAPYLSRNLTCYAGRCFVLAIGSGEPASLGLIELSEQIPAHRSPLSPSGVGPAVSTIARGRNFADVAAVEGPEGRLVAMLDLPTMDDEESSTSPQAQARVNVLLPGGRLRTLSGVAAPQAGVDVTWVPAERVAFVAWGTLDKAGAPQITLTRLSDGGKTVKQRNVTQGAAATAAPPQGLAAESDLGDVSLAAVPRQPGFREGLIVSWADSRDGNAEIYAARLGFDLARIGPDRRLTSARGDSTEPQMLSYGDHVLVAFADARAREDEASSDIFVGALNPQTLTWLVEPRAIHPGPGHSHSPRWVTASTGPTLTWIEGEAPAAQTGEQGPHERSSIHWTTINPETGIASAIHTLSVPGPLTDLGGYCREATCVAIAMMVGVGLVEIPLEASSPLAMRPLFKPTAGSAATFAVANAQGTGLAIGDELAPGSGKLRWLTLSER